MDKLANNNAKAQRESLQKKTQGPRQGGKGPSPSLAFFIKEHFRS
jgi:hypothetical protein